MSAKSPDKTTKKTFDVTRPGKSAPSTSAKPIIVTNRPILKDPMMVGEDLGADKGKDQLSPGPRSKKIKPLNEAAVQKPSEKEPVQTDKDSAETIKVDVKVQPRSDSAVTSAGKSEEQTDQLSPPAEPEAEPPKPSGGEGDQDPDSDEGEPLSETDEKKPSPEKTAEDEKAAKEAAEYQARLEKLIVSRQYYLPINAVSKRRTKRHVAVGLLLVIILAAAWVDVSLDAGIIHLGGVKSFTHFFSQ